jgi:hypothetical protein
MEAKVVANHLQWANEKGSNNWQQVNGNLRVQEALPEGVYNLSYNGMSGQFSLVVTDPLVVPKKLYGDVQGKVARIITWHESDLNDGNTGVLLCGLKGTGKSVLAKKIAMDSGYPVIIVDTDYTEITPNFIPFLSSLNQPVVLLFDEFEKKFGEHEGQEKLLSLVDGTSATKNIVVFTANNYSSINQFYINRPGRVRYLFKYSGLPMDIVENIVDDLLLNKDKRDAVLRVLSLVDSGDLTYDRVISYIYEVNLFNDMSPAELLNGFNVISEGTKDYAMQITFNKLKNSPKIELNTEVNFLNFDGEFYYSDRMNCLLARILNMKDPSKLRQWQKEFLEYYDDYKKVYYDSKEKIKFIEGLRALAVEGKVDSFLPKAFDDYYGHESGHCNWLTSMECKKVSASYIEYESPNGDITIKFKPYKVISHSLTV